MFLSRRVRFQLAFFALVTLIAGGIMAVSYLDVQRSVFGIGEYEVTVALPASAGLYKSANVTYRGVEVGRIEDVRLSATGVDATLSLDPRYRIPADLDAEVHSQTAIGELYLELKPRSGEGPVLKNGDVIPVDRAKLPTDINALLTSANRGLQAIPHDDLKTVIDEAYTAVGGLGPELRRIVTGATTLSIDARKNLDSITTVIDQSKSVLDTQIDSSDSIQAWAANVATVTGQLQSEDSSLNGVLTEGPGAIDEARALIDRLKPTLPIVLANLVTLDQVGITYQPNLEQVLVLLPPLVEMLQGSSLANRFSGRHGLNLSFNLNINLPHPCNTGFLPPQQQRPPSLVDYPASAVPGDLYCRVPQDSGQNVRGVRNVPCETRPGKRAPTVKLCESDEQYVPLNDGDNWKGDPNATLTGQPVPDLPPGSPAPAVPPIATATYDPATGTYVGPDGQPYTQSNMAANGSEPRTLQDLMLPPAGN